MRHIIIGGGVAAAAAAEAIAAGDPQARITVVGDEEFFFYYRPMLPLVVSGERGAESLQRADPLPAGVELLYDRAEAVAAEGNEVRLASGRSLEFDRLLIATGGAARVPAIEGAQAESLLTLRSLADAKRLAQAAATVSRAVVIGGGFVGIKTACALRHRGLAVSVVEQMATILAPRLDSEGARIAADHLRAAGIDIWTSEKVTAISGKELHLAGGGVIDADLVVIAAGVRPNTAFLGKDSGIEVKAGIKVDERMQTSRPGVYAAGDVAETVDFVSGQPMVSGLWSNAAIMGRTAGVNMAGGKRRAANLIAVMNATELMGLPVISAGDLTAAGDGVETRTERRNGSYRRIVFRHGIPVGLVMIGDIQGAGVLVNRIRHGIAAGA